MQYKKLTNSAGTYTFLIRCNPDEEGFDLWVSKDRNWKHFLSEELIQFEDMMEISNFFEEITEEEALSIMEIKEFK